MSSKGDSNLSSRSQIRSLRNKRPIDYSKMHKGEEQTLGGNESDRDSVENLKSEIPLENPSGGASGEPQFEPVSGQNIPLYEDEDREQDELEMAQIQLEMKRLNAEEERLNRKKRLDQMKKELQEQKQHVRSLKGKETISVTKTNDSGTGAIPKTSSSKPSGSKPSKETKTVKTKSKHDTKTTVLESPSDIEKLTKFDEEQLTIDDLRKNPELQKQVQKQLNKIGLKCVSFEECSSSSDYESSDSSSSSDSESTKKKKKHKKRKRSGISAKASDKVKDPQRWPQAYLQYEFVNKQVKFDQLDFKLFLAGEISIISSDDLSESERQGRLSLLKKIIYYSGTYEFKGLKALYAAWLREIELGKKSWSDDPQQIEGAILSKYLLRGKGYSSFKENSSKSDAAEDRTWFCSEYQRNKCKHKSSHLRVHNGKRKLANHICATCWLKDKKKLEHPECSSSCPHMAD